MLICIQNFDFVDEHRYQTPCVVKKIFLSLDTDLYLVELLGEYTDEDSKDSADNQIQKDVEGYQCPDCNKLLNISGFWGHMLR